MRGTRPGAAAKVESVGLDARNLITVPPDDPLWKLPAVSNLGWAKGSLAGAIVRVQPPAGVAQEFIDELRRFLSSAGVAAMRFESAAQAEVPVFRAKPREHQVPRAVVMAMADERPRRDELRAILDYELAKVGL